MKNKTKMDVLKDTTVYTGSNFFAQLLGLVISVMTKRYMGPAMVGVWNIMRVILGYCDYVTLGTSKAAFREIPYHRGRKEWDQAERVKNEVFTFTFMMACIPAVGIAVYAFWNRAQHPNYFFVGLLYIATIVILQRIYDYYTKLLMANKEFLCIAQVTILSAVLNLIFVFALVKPFNIYGLFIASYLSTLIGFLFVQWKTKYRFKFTLSKKGLSKLLGIGIPLLLVGLCAQTIRSIDKILIAKYLGMVALGNYSIPLMVHQYVVGVPNMFAIVLYPRLQEKFGERGSAEGIKNYLIQPIWIASFVTAFLIGLSILTVSYLVHWILPQFVEGIPILKIFLWSSFFFAIGQQASTFLITLDKQWRMLPILVLGIALIFGLDLAFIKLGWGLAGVAFGVVVGALIYNVILIFYAKSHFAGAGETLWFIGGIFLLFLYFFTVTNALAFMGKDHDLGSVLLRVVGYLGLCVPCAWFINRKCGLFSILRAVWVEKWSTIFRPKAS